MPASRRPRRASCITTDRPGHRLAQPTSPSSPRPGTTGPNGLRNRVDLMQAHGRTSSRASSAARAATTSRADWIATRFDVEGDARATFRRPPRALPACWGYRSTDGLGLLEFLAVGRGSRRPAAARGLRRVQRSAASFVKPGPGLQRLTSTDAIDEIEYVTGDTGTKWGARRARPRRTSRRPFPLHVRRNRQRGQLSTSPAPTTAAIAQFYDALKARYPKLQAHLHHQPRAPRRPARPQPQAGRRGRARLQLRADAF
jgi:hypothetical protein